MSRFLALMIALLLAAGCASAQSGKKTASASDADDSQTSSTQDSNKSSDSDSSSDSDDSNAVSYEKGKKLPPGPACLDQQGNIQECLSDTDCCKNFYCGIDPDGNPRQKVCLYSGG